MMEIRDLAIVLTAGEVRLLGTPAMYPNLLPRVTAHGRKKEHMKNRGIAGIWDD